MNAFELQLAQLRAHQQARRAAQAARRQRQEDEQHQGQQHLAQWEGKPEQRHFCVQNALTAHPRPSDLDLFGLSNPHHADDPVVIGLAGRCLLLRYQGRVVEPETDDGLMALACQGLLGR